MRYKILALFLLAATVGTAAVSATHLSGEGTIDRMQVIPTNISNNTQMTVLISVYDQDGNPVNPNKCPSLGVQYVYNSTYGGERDGKNMTYIENTTNRFYATFPVSTMDTTIDFYADGVMWGSNCPPPLGYVHDNVTINPKRNLSVTLLNATPNDRFVEGKTYSLWTNVTYNDSFIRWGLSPPSSPNPSDRDVQWSLHNPNGTMVKEGVFTNQSSYYNTTITFPDASAGRYFLNITAHIPEKGIVNATG
ncbi:MAG: hypothetical protein SVU32_05525, partial [Candidatus Nanohaloarchaea archaeon]|nr:hypothetical protein [Candidatus Nanohaloarchaea archaeon]